MVKHFEDSLLEKKYVIECNLERRHLTTYQKIELGIALLDIENDKCCYLWWWNTFELYKYIDEERIIIKVKVANQR